MVEGSTKTLSLEPSEEILIKLAKKQVLDEEVLKQGLKIAGLLPGRQEWANFISLILQVLGSLFLVSGIIFFFAFNWADMQKFAKLGLLAFALIATVGVAYWRNLDRVSGKVALTAASALVGALLAVYGQTYQTGADSYQLFLFWAVLITAWVIISRFSPLWVFWILLLNLSIIFYWVQMIGDMDARLYLALFLLNGAGLLLFELAQSRDLSWLQNRWVPRILSLPTVASLAIPAGLYITQSWLGGTDSFFAILTVLFFLVSVAGLFVYSRIRLDPFILLVCAGGLILVTNFWILNRFNFETTVLLLASILILVEAAVVVIWLRRLTKVQEVESQ